MSDWDARVQSHRTAMAGLEPVGPGGLVGPVTGELLPRGLREIPLERLQRWQVIASIVASCVVILAGVTTLMREKR